jgi:hypothetical protein
MAQSRTHKHSSNNVGIRRLLWWRTPDRQHPQRRISAKLKRLYSRFREVKGTMWLKRYPDEEFKNLRFS